VKPQPVAAIVYHAGVTTTNGKAPRTEPRRRYGVEKEWMPLLVKMGHTKLRYGFMGAGVPPQVASGLVFFLEDQLTLERHQTDQTRTRYRKVLRDLDIEDVEEAADNFGDDQPIMHTLREAA
jgi:hypothetical protein